MEADSRQAAGETDRPELVSPFYVLLAIPTLLGVAHHVDHIVRGNHVGWPLVAEVNAFTYSLAIYPLIALGLYLTVTDRVGADYWTVLFTGSAGLLAFLHLSPWAVEPPGDVILPYATPVAGYLAFAVLLGLIASVTLAAAYAAVLWYRGAW
jgi:hypothetical protein